MAQRFLVVANWKANNPKFEIQSAKWAEEIGDEVEAAIAAPFPFIDGIAEPFSRAAQDVSAFPMGAYTGEIPAGLLAKLGVKYVLVGHPERRKYLHETTADVEAKMEATIKAGMIPIVCAQNLEEVPPNIRNFSADKYLIMYEPFEAISSSGQYHPESPERISAVLSGWRAKLPSGVRFLYGGSVSPENVQQLIKSTEPQLICGLVVGHASLEAETLSAIIERCLTLLTSY